MNDKNCLSSLTPGECATVEGINANSTMHRRLLDIGLVRGTQVQCIGTAPCGDPSAYLIRGAVIAIRSEDADSVLIKRGVI